MSIPVEQRMFHAKTILFGEHLVLRGEAGLVVPLRSFGGKWTIAQNSLKYYKSLTKWADWLASQTDLHYWLDVDDFRQSIDAGYRFESDVPPGYGAGSSGALVAAVAHHFQREPLSVMPLGALQGYLARLESFFHGTSSGIDPLVSYLNRAILTTPSSAPVSVELPPLDRLHIFLADTRQPRLSGQLISEVSEVCKTPHVAQMLQDVLIPASQHAIQSLLKGDAQGVWDAVDAVSRFQLRYWPFLFPGETQKWVEGSFAGNKYRLKICGTGGGGFMLGFARDMQLVRQALPHVRLTEIL